MLRAIDPGIFKAYDIRGTHPEEIDGDVAEQLGRAFARVLAELGGKPAGELRIGLGRDMRLAAPELAGRYRDGMVAEGAHVVDAGMVGTEMLYWLVGSRELDGGLMCTASHNPARYTGAKLVERGAVALSGDRGIGEMRDLIAAGLPATGDTPPGSFEEVDVYAPFQQAALAPRRHQRDRADEGRARRRQRDGRPDGRPRARRPRPRPRRDLLDAGRHVPRPRAEPAAARRTAASSSTRCAPRAPSSGIAWDGDADRCFFIDDTGEFVPGDFLTALLAASVLEKQPGADILYDVRASRAVPDTVTRLGGRALVNRVGHAFFKTRMRDEGGAFGGEVSGHYYFADFYNADSGTLPALLILELLSREGKALSELVADLRSRYFISGEINSEVADPRAKMDEIAERYGDGEITTLDGVSVDYEDWHFNVRPSNTEPLLRLNLESLVSQDDMERRRDEVLDLIRS